MASSSRDRRHRFHGHIAGVGTEEGTRAVVGIWARSPLGAFADVMVERPDGHRLLLAPSADVADFVAGTYQFDETRLVPVVVRRPPHATPGRPDGEWAVVAGPLSVAFRVAGRTALGRLLGLQPPVLGLSKGWARAVSPLARLVLPGVQTVGTAGGGRREWYAARDEHRVIAVRATWEGADLGSLRPVVPPPAFGFSSTPARPSLVRVVSTVELAPEPGT